MKGMKKCFHITGLLLVMLLSYVGADAQVADSTAVPAGDNITKSRTAQITVQNFSHNHLNGIVMYVIIFLIVNSLTKVQFI